MDKEPLRDHVHAETDVRCQAARGSAQCNSRCSRVYLLIPIACALGVLALLVSSTALSPSSRALARGTATGAQIYYGLMYPEAPDVAALSPYERKIGKGASLVLWYQSWAQKGQPQRFPMAAMDALRRHGSIPVLAWAPNDYQAPNDDSAYSFSKIISGKWDDYIRQYATDAKAWGHPFFLRFASEMNGDWIPWSEVRNGNRAGQFARMWRHVHDVFATVGATNVTWVWCPNVENSATTPLEEVYPGNNYVDWVGMDGYNFGPDLHGAPWRSFDAIFRNTYTHLLKLTSNSKPVMIGETASAEHGGSKSSWITDALTAQLPSRFPQIKALIWFNATDSGLDLRIDTSPASIVAFRAAIATTIYQANTYGLLYQSPIPVPEQFVAPLPPRPAGIPQIDLVASGWPAAIAGSVAALLLLCALVVILRRTSSRRRRRASRGATRPAWTTDRRPARDPLGSRRRL